LNTLPSQPKYSIKSIVSDKLLWYEDDNTNDPLAICISLEIKGFNIEEFIVEDSLIIYIFESYEV
jgi:hypothetical protein